MSWLVVAKRTVLDPYRTRYLWVMLGLFGLVFGFLTHDFYRLTSNGLTEMKLASTLTGAMTVFIPAIAIARSYGTIAKRRQNGSLRVTLSYPLSRRDVVLGTALGKIVLIVGFVSFGFLVACAVALVEHGLPTMKPFLFGWLAILLLGSAMTGLAVGISASARTTNRAVLASFAMVFLFMIWQRDTIYAVLGKLSIATAVQPEWVNILVALSPIKAYNAIVSDSQLYGSDVSGFYTTEWFGALVLLAWLVLPLLVGLWRFGRNDL